MAILKQMHLKADKGADPSRHLRNCLDYILKPQKCDHGRLAGAKNCVAESNMAYELMMRTKKAHGKLHGRQGYHYVLSFARDEVTPETALEITEKFVDEYLQGQYEAVYAVHTDTAHIHSHIVFNSVGLSGYKYHAPKGEWEHVILPIVNDLCAQYGLSQVKPKRVLIEEVDYPAESGEEDIRNTGGWEPGRKKKNPMYGRKGSGYGGSSACMAAMIRRDIDECICLSDSMEEFYRFMEARGYRLRIGGSREPGLQHESMERIRRFSSLGEGYSLGEIQAAILNGEKPEPEPGIAGDQLPEGFAEMDEPEDSVPAQLCREMRFRFVISGEAYSRAAIFPYAKNCREEFEAYREAYEFVHAHNIRSMDEIERMHAEMRAEWSAARNALRRKRRQMKESGIEELMSYVEQYHALSDAEALYRSGDEAFFEDYMEAEALKDKIRSCGATVSGAEQTFGEYQAEISRLKRKQADASETLRQISRVKTMLRKKTLEEVAQRLEQNEAEKQRKRSAERTRERRQ